MKFKVGKLYRVIKDNARVSGCVGCILRYESTNDFGTPYGIPVKIGEYCRSNHTVKSYCSMFRWVIQSPDFYELVEHESMVKFCKKLRKQRKKAT